MLRTTIGKFLFAIINFLANVAEAFCRTCVPSDTVREVRERTINDMHSLMTSIWMGTYDESLNIEVKKVYLSFTEYTEVVPGIYHRAIQSADDLNGRPIEVKSRAILNDIDFNSSIVVFQVCERDAYFKPHLHNSEERVWIVQGDLYDPVRDIFIKKDASVTTPAYKLHALYSRDESLSVLEFKKKQSDIEFDLGNERLHLVNPEIAQQLDEQHKQNVIDKYNEQSHRYEEVSSDSSNAI